MNAENWTRRLPLLLVPFSLASCGGEENAPGTCRTYPQVITWENGSRTYNSFDAETNTFVSDDQSGYLETETWVYRSKEDFIREAERPGLGLHVEYVRQYQVGSESEQRSYSDDNRLLRSETLVSDNGLSSFRTDFDTWDDMDRPLRGFSTYWDGTPDDHFYSCELMQQTYRYDEEKNQVTIETAPGVDSESGEVCRGGVFLDVGIQRVTFDEYGFAVRREFWDHGADINVAPPNLVKELSFQASLPESVCL